MSMSSLMDLQYDEAIVDRVRQLTPVFSERGQLPDESALYDFCTEIHGNHAVSDATYKAALEQFGERGVVELTGLIGHYTTVSMTLNAFEVPLPEGAEAPLPA